MDQTYNVLCIGGSVVFALTVDQSDLTAVDMLQERMGKITANGKPVRFYNGGILGATTGAIAHQLMPYYAKIKPDLVLFYEAVNTQPEGFNVGIPLLYNSYLETKKDFQNKRKAVQDAMKTYDSGWYHRDLTALTKVIQQTGAVPAYITFSAAFNGKEDAKTLDYWDRMSTVADARAISDLVRMNNEQMLKVVAEQKVYMLESRPELDAKPEYFIDHVHMTQAGLKILSTKMEQAVRDLAPLDKPDP